jgi:glycosyltransferase involved in cell wall biosynthesis
VPSISVVVPAHNVEQVLGETLESLCRQDYQGTWDVVVVDNGSTDHTSDVALSYSSRLSLTVVSATDGQSAAYARNAGIKASTGAWVVLVDGDDTADSRLLSSFARHMSEYDVMGASVDDVLLNDAVVASWRYSLTQDGLPLALGRFPVLHGGWAVRRDVFDRVGYFDESLQYFGEDVDHSIRMHLAGVTWGWIPEAIVHYRHRNSLKALARQQYIYGRGSVQVYERYRHVAAPESRTAVSIRQAGRLLRGLPNLARSRSRRGQWIRFASFMGGQFVESLRRRVWYVG